MSGVRVKKNNESGKNKFVAVVFFIGLIAILAWIGYGIYLFAKRFKFIPKPPDSSKEIA
jgi:TM2 domain-containing membrane protein YozV